MKSLKSYTALIIIAMIACATSIFAQSNNGADVPQNIAAAFKTKYPDAQVKSWITNNDGYTAKAKGSNGKYFASFDKSGNWTKTVTTYYWPGHLTPEVRNAFRKSEYGGWHIYRTNVVETPAGKFYQVLVDDSNHKINANHQELFTEDRLVEYKATGELVVDKNINYNPTLD